MKRKKKIALDPDQQAALEMFRSGRSFFLTGEAGTGKSFVVERMIAETTKEVAVTAATGIAACHLGGITLHRWSGSGIARKPPQAIADEKWWRFSAPRIRDVDVLIVDECFDYKQPILTEHGWEYIGSVVNQQKQVRVWSMSPDGEMELKPIVGWMRKRPKTDELLKINASRTNSLRGARIIRCTADHKIKTPTGYVRAGRLTEGDFVIVKSPSLTQEQPVGRQAGAFAAVPVRSIERTTLSKTHPYVYDIEVADHHNYIAGNIVVSNCSMLDGDYIDRVDGLCQIARDDPAPFGGLQVLFVGDYHQLPPVELDDHGYAFQSDVWRRMSPLMIELKHVHRQEDREFAALLNMVRVGNASPELEAAMVKRTIHTSRQEMADDPEIGYEQAVKMMTHNRQVDVVNEEELAKIDVEEHVFIARDLGSPGVSDRMDKCCLAPRILRLKEGARVMFLKNHRDGLWVNGTVGTVAGWAQGLRGECPVVEVDGAEHHVPVATFEVNRDGKAKKKRREGETEEEYEERLLMERIARGEDVREQYPLRLAYAATVHKMQGMTLDSAIIDLSRAFAPGQAYVGLSRVRTIETLYLSGWTRDAVKVDPVVLDFYEQERSRA